MVRRGPGYAGDVVSILLVEDEVAIGEGLTTTLGAEGFRLSWVRDGTDAIRTFEREKPDLVLLDLMLPGTSGTEICRQLRADSDVPIIMLTAKDAEVDKVVGLELGADDYVTKPFSIRELVARVRAVLRRGGRIDAYEPGAPIQVRDVRVDPERYEVAVRGAPVQLPPKEFALLELLIRNAGRVLTRDVLIDRIWGADYVGDTKTLDVHIKRLRARIEADPHQPGIILTVRGVGYKFADTVPAP
jgi:two-component system, OmpR family, response regulator RegX3